jgi:hypothetical protein
MRQKEAPRGKPFEKGFDERRAIPMPVKRVDDEPVPGELVDSERQGTLLAAMQHVVSQPVTRDRTELQRVARKWLAEDVTRFMSKLADLELKVGEQGVGVCPVCEQRRKEDEEEEADEQVLRDVLQKVIDRANEEAVAAGE